MKASKFTEAQKAFILKQGEEGTSVAEICRKSHLRYALEQPLIMDQLPPLSAQAGRPCQFKAPEISSGWLMILGSRQIRPSPWTMQMRFL